VIDVYSWDGFLPNACLVFFFSWFWYFGMSLFVWSLYESILGVIRRVFKTVLSLVDILASQQ
jgi:hypothetical protein